MSQSFSPLKTFFIILVLLFGIGWSFFSLRSHYSKSAALDVWMLDVGQGESVFLHDPSGKKILFDGGPDESVLSELGGILPAWDRTIDLIILSHNHSDHLHGIISVLERYQVKEVWISGALYDSTEYEAFREQITLHHLQPVVKYFDPASCKAQSICPPIVKMGDLNLQVYRPLQNMTGFIPHDPHDATVSVKFSYRQQSIFLTGDLNEGHEQALMQACHSPQCSLVATVLQVPHHGSATGLAPYFLRAVSPRLALIPVGLNNTFGHPAASTLEKLKTARVPTYRTDTEGQIHVVLFKTYFTVQAKKPG